MKKLSEYNRSLSNIDFDPYCRKFPIDLLLSMCEIPNFKEFLNELEKLILKFSVKEKFLLNDIALGKIVIGKILS